jgi:MoxR-like ATPase
MASFHEDFQTLRGELSKRIVGMDEVVEGLLWALTAGGHVLLEGGPGLGKTSLVRTLSETLPLAFQRIQCTSDLVPADVIGTYVIMETPQGRRSFEFQKGPLFANLVLADQINRTSPKTQSALLEAMDEPAITVATETFRLPEPYLLVATQNSADTEGTFPLPEAQLDRFFVKLRVTSPTEDQLEEILRLTTAVEKPPVRKVLDAARLVEMQREVREVSVSDAVRRRAIRLVVATDPTGRDAPEGIRRYVRCGASPRGAQTLILASKARALSEGRGEATDDDLRSACHPSLRHRLGLGFEGLAEGIDPDALLDEALQSVGLGNPGAPA